jgi:hypothetical protein
MSIPVLPPMIKTMADALLPGWQEGIKAANPGGGTTIGGGLSTLPTATTTGKRKSDGGYA